MSDDTLFNIKPWQPNTPIEKRTLTIEEIQEAWEYLARESLRSPDQIRRIVPFKEFNRLVEQGVIDKDGNFI